MALAAATRLGAYEILSPLGAGGMGEVYRARDSKLGREVAIKVLPAEVSSDRNRLVRFEQEARSASALNHPNIVTIYEIGSVDSVSYIAMELVQGKTLRELLTEGPLPAKRLLALSAQIADGLARAHEAGIVHRDLKPDNVMVTREGLVKILDFGLAKLAGSSGPEMSQLPTIAEPTEPGTVLGTVGYMSPEQAMGRPVDFRSDQFSLGAILSEMATGKRAFSRGSAPETMAAIIREEPESLSGLAPRLPVALRWVIERCLAKGPEERYGSTRDLARDLAQVRDHISGTGQDSLPARPSHGRGRLLAAWAASLILVAVLALVVGPRSRHEPSTPPVRFGVSIPGEVIGSRVTVSPDGMCLAIESFSRGQRRIYLRRLDSDETVELQGAVGAAGHFWSPDSRQLAFFADGKVKKIPIAGGPPVELCDADMLTAGAWSPEGTILFPRRANPPGLFRVSDAGGEPVRVTACKSDEENRWPWLVALHGERRPVPWAHTRFTEWTPRFSPDGRWIAYQSDESGIPEIYVALTQGGRGKRHLYRRRAESALASRWKGAVLHRARRLCDGGADDTRRAGGSGSAGAALPVALRVETMGGVATYDVTADGSRFLIGIPADSDRESQVNVVVNWPAGLKRPK